MFDPNIPATNAEATLAMFRGQFQGLKALIDAVPGVTSAVVDSVTTLPADEEAAVSVSVVGGLLHLSFSIPEGQSGPPGEVTQAALDAGLAATLAQTSANSNAVAVLGEIADSSYNRPQIQKLINKVDELILMMRRGA